MSLFEEFKEKYLKDDLIDFFIEKRKFILENNKKDYLNAMVKSSTDSTLLKHLLKNALTDKINDRELFMKGIDYSYYYEENE